MSTSVEISISTLELESASESSENATAGATVELPVVERIFAILQSPRFQSEIVRSLLAVFSLFISVMATAVATALNDSWFHENAPKILPGPDGTPPVMAAFATHPLFDHFATYLPDWSNHTTKIDWGLNIYVVVSMLVTLGLPIKTRLLFQPIIVLRRVLWILSFLYGFRVITFIVTAVPSATPRCVPKYLEGVTGYMRVLRALNAATSCTDNIYSGHTSMAAVIFFMNFTYSGRFWFNFFSGFVAIVIIVGIIASKMHYTIDVVVALFMSSFLWCIYHFLLIIYIDQEVLRSLRVNEESLQRSGGDPAIICERRLLNRFINRGFLWVLRWLDGMDIRTTFAKTRHYGRHLTPTITQSESNPQV